MLPIDALLHALATRLPELRWKLGEFKALLPSQNIPKGLFRCPEGKLTAEACIAEIEEDIQRLSLQAQEKPASYLAFRIQQKVNVLVFICQSRKKGSQKTDPFQLGIKSLTTRQQWLESLHQEISVLEQQKRALGRVLAQMESANNMTAVLAVQSELGQLEKRLCLAKEAGKETHFI